MRIPPGSVDRNILIYARDTLTGTGKTGLVAASINAMYTRVETDNDVTIAAVTETNLTALTDAHSDGGWYPVDATNAPGLYRFDLPDAVCATGAWEAVVTIIDAGSNNFEIAPTRIELKNDYAATDIVSAGAITTLSGAVVNVDLVDTVTAVTGLTASNVGAIKTKTDSLNFTVAGQVDANIQYVNDVAVTGTGAAGNEWGP